MTDTTARDAKLIQYLNEAYAMEMHLETALQAHISMTTDNKYRQRLKEHLTETRRHARVVRGRVKSLGGTPETVQAPGPEIVSETAGALLGGAEKALALAQGPLHALRGTSAAEKQLKNAKTEYASEAQEIATYRAIEALAESLADRETVRLARTNRREEERMSTFLEREIPRLTKAVVSAEIPAAQRRPPARKRSTTRKASATSRGGSSSRGGARAKATPSAKSTSSRPRASAGGRTKPTSRVKNSTRAKSTTRAKATSRAKATAPAKGATRTKRSAK